MRAEIFMLSIVRSPNLFFQRLNQDSDLRMKKGNFRPKNELV